MQAGCLCLLRVTTLLNVRYDLPGYRIRWGVGGVHDLELIVQASRFLFSPLGLWWITIFESLQALG